MTATGRKTMLFKPSALACCSGLTDIGLAFLRSKEGRLPRSGTPNSVFCFLNSAPYNCSKSVARAFGSCPYASTNLSAAECMFGA
jgi:hypothetical protein